MRLTYLLAFAAAAAVSPALAHEVVHAGHDHAHGAGCGHQAVAHAGHVDYLHDGHMHMAHAGHVDEHIVFVTKANPAAEKPVPGHAHKMGDKHETVQHGTHFDCVHDGRLHHAHGDHTDDHGALPAA